MDAGSPDRRMFNLGALFMAGLLICGDAVHWFITPAVYEASGAQQAAVLGQAVLALALAIWAYMHSRRVGRSTSNRAIESAS